jgi:hypothetical protein
LYININPFRTRQEEICVPAGEGQEILVTNLIIDTESNIPYLVLIFLIIKN